MVFGGISSVMSLNSVRVFSICSFSFFLGFLLNVTSV